MSPIPPVRMEAVLLDMGGVLVDMRDAGGLPTGGIDARGRRTMLARIAEGGGSADEAMLDELLFGPWRSGYERRYETGTEEPWEPHLERLVTASGTEVEPMELLEGWFAPYRELLRPAPDSRRVVGRLHRDGFALGLVSNVPLPGRLYSERLREWGIAERLDSLAFSYDVGRRKPAPTMIEQTLAELGVSADRAVMVGDRRGSDVAAGRTAGVWTVWLEGDDGGGPHPHVSIAELRELPDLLATGGEIGHG